MPSRKESLKHMAGEYGLRASPEARQPFTFPFRPIRLKAMGGVTINEESVSGRRQRNYSRPRRADLADSRHRLHEIAVADAIAVDIQSMAPDHVACTGDIVNVAARVTEAGGGGEVLVTEAAAVAAGELRGVELSRPRRRRFKGVDEAVRVHRASPVG